MNDDREVLRKQYLETIVPPFAALFRRWRPLLSGIHEFTDAEGQSPLAVEDRPLAVDAPPLEVFLPFVLNLRLEMLSPANNTLWSRYLFLSRVNYGKDSEDAIGEVKAHLDKSSDVLFAARKAGLVI